MAWRRPTPRPLPTNRWNFRPRRLPGTPACPEPGEPGLHSHGVSCQGPDTGCLPLDPRDIGRGEGGQSERLSRIEGFQELPEGNRLPPRRLPGYFL